MFHARLHVVHRELAVGKDLAAVDATISVPSKNGRTPALAPFSGHATA